MRLPGPETSLEHYPWVVVRFRCTHCKRYGDAKLARLAEKFGATETIAALVERFTKTCPYVLRRKNGTRALDQMPCGAYCPDLMRDGPPDLPPSMAALRLIAGGRDDMLPADTPATDRRRRVGGEE